MSWWETLHLVTWWKRLGISAIKTGQDAPSWIWCTERLSFFGGGHIVLQRFVHVRCHFQPLPTKLVFAYFDRGSYVRNVTPSFREHLPACIMIWTLTQLDKTERVQSSLIQRVRNAALADLIANPTSLVSILCTITLRGQNDETKAGKQHTSSA